MRYCLEWRLLGREEKCLDRGEIDGGFHERLEAMQALGAFLQQFQVWGRGERDGTWWARRSEEADMEVRITLREAVMEGEPAPAPWMVREQNDVHIWAWGGAAAP